MEATSSQPAVRATQWNAKLPRLHVAACTDKGRVRLNNEDSYHVYPDANLFVLSDGMGGAARGEVASAMAVEMVGASVQDNFSMSLADKSAAKPGFSDETNSLIRAIQLANRKIHEEGVRDPASRGMGATIVAVRINGNRASLAHVGDSRVYLFRRHTLQQLTSDHSLVAEQVRQGLMSHQQAAASELQSVLTRALGMEESIEVDAEEMELLPGDSLLLCSDGLTRMLPENEIAATLTEAPDVAMAAERLVQRANECGGLDNITVVVIHLAKTKGWLAKFFPWGSANLL